MAGGKKDEKEKLAPIIIKRVKKVAGGHHGGAWKVAYADFVTAMMAFFLLLWLLNVTTEDQKNAISNYFDPTHPKIADVMSGAGGILRGLSMSADGAMVSTVQPIAQPEQPDSTTRGHTQGDTKGTDEEADDKGTLSEAQLETELRKKEDERFKQAADNLKAEISKSPELKEMINNLIIDITPEGLRIQIVDDKGRSMFPSGSAQMFDFMRQILLKVTGVIKPLPNQVSVRGHTDSFKYKDPNRYDNWNLSSDRAQASRRVMLDGGLSEVRIENVMGRADREHLLPKEPQSPRNRRISIILLRERLITKAAKPAAPAIKTPAETEPKKPATGIQIIDDTAQPQTPPAQPQGQSQPAGDGKKPAILVEQDSGGERPLTPLPTSPSGGIQRQPQVVTFGEDTGKTQGGDALYDGPTQSPFETNKPPTITTPAFNLPSNQPHATEGHGTPPATQDAATNGTETKTFTFGDEAPTTPTKPLAPAAFPPEAPAQPAAQAPRQLEFGDAEVAPAAPAQPTPDSGTAKGDTQKALSFP